MAAGHFCADTAARKSKVPWKNYIHPPGSPLLSLGEFFLSRKLSSPRLSLNRQIATQNGMIRRSPLHRWLREIVRLFSSSYSIIEEKISRMSRLIQYSESKNLTPSLPRFPIISYLFYSPCCCPQRIQDPPQQFCTIVMRYTRPFCYAVENGMCSSWE